MCSYIYIYLTQNLNLNYVFVWIEYNRSHTPFSVTRMWTYHAGILSLTEHRECLGLACRSPLTHNLVVTWDKHTADHFTENRGHSHTAACTWRHEVGSLPDRQSRGTLNWSKIQFLSFALDSPWWFAVSPLTSSLFASSALYFLSWLEGVHAINIERSPSPLYLQRDCVAKNSAVSLSSFTWNPACYTQ